MGDFMRVLTWLLTFAFVVLVILVMVDRRDQAMAQECREAGGNPVGGMCRDV